MPRSTPSRFSILSDKARGINLANLVELPEVPVSVDIPPAAAATIVGIVTVSVFLGSLTYFAIKKAFS